MLAHLERNHRLRLRQKFPPIVEGHLFEALVLLDYCWGLLLWPTLRFYVSMDKTFPMTVVAYLRYWTVILWVRVA